MGRSDPFRVYWGEIACQDFYICPQHLPILIHKPAQLADKLPGAEKLADSSPDHD
ncbi:MAG: hypothetical protein JW862_14535 [Anaerolineales bacterium]|nr:hypothetical protein [Anaerolineales bacterium]